MSIPVSGEPPSCRSCGTQLIQYLDFTRGTSSLRCPRGCDDRRELHRLQDALRKIAEMETIEGIDGKYTWAWSVWSMQEIARKALAGDEGQAA